MKFTATGLNVFFYLSMGLYCVVFGADNRTVPFFPLVFLIPAFLLHHFLIYRHLRKQYSPWLAPSPLLVGIFALAVSVTTLVVAPHKTVGFSNDLGGLLGLLAVSAVGIIFPVIFRLCK